MQLLSSFTVLTGRGSLPVPSHGHPLASVESFVNFCRLSTAIDDTERQHLQSGEVFRDLPGLSFPAATVLRSTPYVDLRRRVDEMRQILSFECSQGQQRKKDLEVSCAAHLQTKDLAESHQGRDCGTPPQ